jgi:outer membrane lipoprotein-sorting protein
VDPGARLYLVPTALHPTMKIMPKTRRLVPVALALFLGLASSSCLFTRRVILRHGKKVTQGSTPVLLAATRDELNTRIATLYNAINSFQATVDLTPSVGSVYTGQITEIKDVRAFVLFRKPSDISILGLTPFARTRAFEMVSNGKDFKLVLYTRSLFIEGANDAPPTSKNKLENLRPDAFLSSMLIRPAELGVEIPVLEDDTDEDNAVYRLHFIRQAEDGTPMIARNVWFDRIDLSIVRQKVLDKSGAILSDTRYSKWQPYNGVMFPSHIDLNRPQDGYGLVMDLVDMKMNINLTDDKFALTQPEGYTLQVIGAPK